MYNVVRDCLTNDDKNMIYVTTSGSVFENSSGWVGVILMTTSP